MSRMSIVFLLLVTLFSGAVGTGYAQDAWPQVMCGDLSEADCAILEKSQEAMSGLTSSSFAMDMDMALQVSDPEFEGFELSLAMEGAAGSDPATLEPFMAMKPTDMAAVMDMLPEALPTLLQGVDADIVLDVTLPEEILMEMGMPEGIPSIEMLMTDGVLYLYLEPFMPAETDSSMQMPAWMGFDLAAMSESLFAIMEDEGMMEEMPDMMEFQEMFNNETLWTMYDPELYSDFITITRVDDEVIDGQAMAVFEMDFDYGAAFADEEVQAAFAEYMDVMMEMQGESMDEMPENFMDIMVTMMDGMDMFMVQWVGLEDSYMHYYAMDMTYDMDFTALAEAMPEEDMSDAPEEFYMAFSMSMTSSDFNEPVVVTAPEGAEVIDPLALFATAPSIEG